MRMLLKNFAEISEPFDYKRVQTTPVEEPESLVVPILTPYQEDQTIKRQLCLSTLVPEYIK